MVTLASFTRSGVWSVLAQATQVVGGLLLSVIVVRALTAVEFGQLSVLRQITALVVIISSLAIERTLLRYIPELMGGGDLAASRRLFANGLILRLVAWLPFLLASVLLRHHVARLLGTAANADLPIAVATAAIFSLHNHIRAAATARFATSWVAVGSAVGSVVGICATILALRAGHGIAGVLVAAAIGLAIAAAIQLPAAWGTPAASAGSSASVSIGHRRLISYALPFAMITVLNHIVHSQTEVYFLAHFQGAEAAGHFQLGFLFAQRVIDFLPLALWEVSMAGFSHIVASDPTKLQDAVRDYLTLLYLLMAPAAMLGVAFSRDFIQLLYGVGMEPAVAVSQWYFLVAGLAAFNAPIGMIIYARERTGYALAGYCLFAVANLALNVLWIPRYGLAGAIAALAAGKILNVLVFARIAWREVPTLSVPWRFLVRAWVASAIPLVWLWAGPSSPTWIVATAALLAGVLLIAVNYRLLRVVGHREADLVRRTGLPMNGILLRLVGGPT